jgi:hypothetical protein
VKGEGCQLIVAKATKLLKLYMLLYAHAPTNNDYLTIFMAGWLAQRKEKDVN